MCRRAHALGRRAARGARPDRAACRRTLRPTARLAASPAHIVLSQQYVADATAAS